MKIYLKKNEHRRIKAGHLWVFSNEIEYTEGFSSNGSISDLYSNNKNFLGRGVFNKNSLIAFRLLSYRRDNINKDFFINAFKSADKKRKKYFDNSCYRLINGESDFLPGLIIDRFKEYFSIQIFSLGLENLKGTIVSALIDVFSPKCIIERNDFEYRQLEGLDSRKEILFGEPASELNIEIDNIKYNIDLLEGQKTGFYYDQRKNRCKIREFIKKNDTVLDAFSNDGGFGLNALYSGANNVTFIDSSDYSLKNCEINCKLNKFNNYTVEKGDAFEILKRYTEENRLFDFIILDPPSFTKNKKNIKSAEAGYIEINSNSMKLLKPHSIFFTFSCSHHISWKIFEEILVRSALSAGKRIEIIGHSEISPDHQVLPQMPETKYLKGFILLVN